MNIRLLYHRGTEYLKKYGIFKTFWKVIKTISGKLFLNRKIKKEQGQEIKDYQLWIKNNEPNESELRNQRIARFKYEPKISIIVPMYNTKERYFKELVDSIMEQTYCNWELCLADGSEAKAEFIDNIILKNKNIKYKFIGQNKGISGNSNEALEMSTGDYIALLDHDDILPKFSLFEIVKSINETPGVEFIYTDEDKIMEYKENRLGPHFKQDFAPDTLMSYNYICHFSIFKKELMKKLEGFRSEFDGSQDYDLILRATEMTDKILHIPKILYHWRMNENSVALNQEAKPYAYEAAKRAIDAHMKRKDIKGRVEDSKIKGIYRIIYDIQRNPKVSIIIPNKDHVRDLERCIKSIKKSTYNNYEIIVVENNSTKRETFEYYEKLKEDKKIKIVTYKEKEFNYSKINNYAVMNAKGEYLILLNNDTEIITCNWIELIIGNCQRKDVGIVGAKLLYKNKTIQHAGVVLGLGGVAGHINNGENRNHPGYMARVLIQQNYTAVTGALLAISKEDYLKVNGLDESLPIAYNDIDLCLKIRKSGKVVVYNSCVEAYHYESKTRGYEISNEKKMRLEEDSNNIIKKWPEFFSIPDPYFNINFKSDVSKITIRTDKAN